MKFGKSLMAGVALSACVGIAPAAHADVEPFIGEIINFPYTFCPRGFVEASGQTIAIASNSALFSLYGTIYGGDGQQTFNLPNLNGRGPLGQGNLAGGQSYPIGQVGGVETTTMTANQMPTHTHVANMQTAGAVVADTGRSTGSSFAVAANSTYVKSQAPVTGSPMNPNTVVNATVGGNQAQENRQPYLAMRYCVATEGIYPSRN